MALLVSAADGNLTTAATWGLASDGTGAQVTSGGNTVSSSTSYQYSPTFTGTTGHIIDGLALFVIRSTTTGTFTVALSDDNGVTATRSVTVNASDLPADQSWIFFKFGSTLTLDGGTDYRVGIVASSANNVAVFRTATSLDFLRVLRQTTAPGSVAAGDTFLIAGEWTAAGSSTARTITMDSTAATDYGTGVATATAPTQGNIQAFTGLQIGQLGTLTWAASAATNYILRLSGNLVVWSGGTYNQGTVATPCPRDSTMKLEFDCAADGDFGFLAMNGSTVSIQGLSRTSGKNIYWTLLNTDEAANSTSLGVADDTGWLDNDRIAVASTTRTATQCEAGTLNGAAGASTLTVDGFAGSGGGLAFAHSGTSPTQAEVILLTRNVKVQAVTSGLTTYVYIGASATVDVDWCEFRYLGANVTSKRGIDVAALTTGNVDLRYCSVSDCDYNWAYSTSSFGASSTFNLRDSVFWNAINGETGGVRFIGSTGTYNVTDNVFMFAPATNCVRYEITNSTSVFSRNRIIGAGVTGLSVISGAADLGGCDDLVIHSNASTGLGFSNNSQYSSAVMSGWSVWRNGSTGINLTTAGTSFTFENALLFGNSGVNVSASGGTDLTFIDSVFAGDTSFSTTTGFSLLAADLRLITCDLSQVTGIYTAHTQDFSVAAAYAPVNVSLDNCRLGAATEVLNQSNLSSNGAITSSKHDQTAGAYKTWKRGGTIERDTTIFNTAAPSERLTPISASVKLIGSSRLVGVDNAATKTISVYVRKSVIGDGAAYNGNQPRLILKRNDAVGITSDTVLDTMTAAAGSWEQLSATTAAATDDGAFEVYIDCDGTAGFVNVDDWTVT